MSPVHHVASVGVDCSVDSVNLPFCRAHASASPSNQLPCSGAFASLDNPFTLASCKSRLIVDHWLRCFLINADFFRTLPLSRYWVVFGTSCANSTMGAACVLCIAASLGHASNRLASSFARTSDRLLCVPFSGKGKGVRALSHSGTTAPSSIAFQIAWRTCLRSVRSRPTASAAMQAASSMEKSPAVWSLIRCSISDFSCPTLTLPPKNVLLS